jgi:hypothetical protein
MHFATSATSAMVEILLGLKQRRGERKDPESRKPILPSDVIRDSTETTFYRTVCATPHTRVRVLEARSSLCWHLAFGIMMTPDLCTKWTSPMDGQGHLCYACHLNIATKAVSTLPV